MVWSAVVVNLPRAGFAYSADQLFWLAALPGLSGATLRIFYSFMVPIFGGRRWTAISTASLLIPAVGIGFAVQNPSTPYWVFLLLALLCGFGGGNFASSMANISFFFPKAQKGRALGLNAGLGNLGVSAVQLVVPLVITVGMFGALGGAPQQLPDGSNLWLQNAGFVWVPLIVAAAIAAWFGMNDIASAKASFAEQTVIFQRKHNWIMCLLYTGTFGSFIGYSAALPLLIKQQYPEVNPLHFVFLGPLVGSLARSASGGLADRIGGGRVTLWVFVALAIGVLALLFFLSQGDSALGFWGIIKLTYPAGHDRLSHNRLASAAMSLLSQPFFHDEQVAYAFLEAVIWPDGPTCPHCGAVDRIYTLKRQEHAHRRAQMMGTAASHSRSRSARCSSPAMFRCTSGCKRRSSCARARKGSALTNSTERYRSAIRPLGSWSIGFAKLCALASWRRWAGWAGSSRWTRRSSAMIVPSSRTARRRVVATRTSTRSWRW